MAETIGRADIIIEADGDGFENSVRRSIKKAEPGIEKAGDDSRKAFNKGFTNKKHDKDVDNSLTRLGQRLDGIATKISKGFGKGSRNDFLNLFGSFMGMAPRLLGTLAKLGGGFGKLGKDSEDAGGGITSLGGRLKGFASAGLPGLAAAALAVGIAIQGSMTLMGAFGAALSLTTGLVLALAGSLGFALVGGLVAVAGALVPFAAGIGVAALAMAGLDKKSQAVKDLGKTWEGLQKTAAKAVFGKDGAGLKNLQPILESLEPLIKGVGWALNGLLTDLGKVGQSKGFKTMMTDISAQLPGMVLQIGQIGGKLAVGLGQAFVAAAPMIKEFLGFVDDLADKFVAFGEGGSNSGLAKFFTDAWASAKIVGGLIMDIIDLVGVLFSAGKGTGDQIFADIAKQVEKIVTWLSSPEGQKALKQWFADAEVLAGKLGEVVVQVVKFIDALDTPTSREMLFNLIDGVVALIGAFTTLAGFIDQVNQAIIRAGAATLAWLSSIWTQISTDAMTAFQGFVQVWDGLVAFFGPIWTGIINGVRIFMQAFIQVFIDLYNELVGHSIIPDMINDIVGWFARLPGMIAAVLGDLAGRFVIWLAGVPQKIQSSVGLVVGAFSGLAGKAIARAGNIISAFTKWVAGLPAKARAIATSVASGFVGLASKAIAKAGSIASRFASWVSSLPSKARSIANSIASGFGGLAGKVISKAGSIAAKFASWVSGLPGKAKTAANSIANAFSGLAGKVISKAGDLAGKLGAWGRSAVSKAGGVANDIVSKFSGLASRIVRAIGDIVPKIKMPTIKVPTVVAKVITPKKAAGGIVNGAQIVTVGEAGPEAIVPLDRMLSRVDPAVRALSAFAQGKTMPGQATAGPSIGRQIDVGGITINTPTEDPRAVASEVVSRMTFAAYI